jgi:microcystin-dependent protein
MPDEQFIGEIAYFPYNFAPKGWLPCDGRLLPINQNQALFSLLGTTYGGNGQTTFGLPNLNARSAVGTGQGPGLDSINLGQVGGQATVMLTKAQLPAHSHVLGASKTEATASGPTNAVPAQPFDPGASAAYKAYGPTDHTSTMPPATVTTAGGSQPFSIRSPYLGLQCCIAVTGIYPSHN